MKKTSVYLLRENLASYLNEIIKTGDPLMVCKYNKPLVVISLPEKDKTNTDYEKFFGFMTKDERGVDYENRVRRGKKEKDYMRKLKKRIT